MDRLKGKEIVDKISKTVFDTCDIENEWFQKLNVKRGLRHEDHTGVVVGLTKVGDVVGYDRDENGNTFPIPGRLMYRGISLEDIVRGAQKENRLGFEEVVYLILSGNLPNQKE